MQHEQHKFSFRNLVIFFYGIYLHFVNMVSFIMFLPSFIHKNIQLALNNLGCGIYF